MAHSVSILQQIGDKIEIDVPNLLSILKSAGPRPLVIHSINGGFRKGKSLMLNFFLQYLQSPGNPDWFQPTSLPTAFVWSGGSRRVTEGINVWSEPFIRVVDGREVAVLLMDTQGNFDGQSPLQQNAVIFAVSALLSSNMIWNEMRDITDDMLNSLLCFAGFATLAYDDHQGKLTLASDDPGGKRGETCRSFQRLIFLLRDFQYIEEYGLGYSDDNTDPQKNFKSCRLNPDVERADESNNVRKVIHKNFQEIGVFALPHPGNELANGKGASNLDPEFKVYAKEFVEKMFSEESLRFTKHVGRFEVTGETFKPFVKKWAMHFQSTDLPEMKGLLDTNIQIINNLAVKNATTFYETKMHKIIKKNPKGVGRIVLESEHKRMIAGAKIVFANSKKLGGPEYANQYEAELLQELETRYSLFQQIDQSNFTNSNQSNQFQTEINNLNAEITKMNEATYNNERDRKKSDAVVEEYRRKIAAIQMEMENQNRANAAEIQRLQYQLDSLKKDASKSWCAIL